MYELSPTDFSVVRTWGTVLVTGNQGCGGGAKTIWQTDVFSGNGRLHRRSPSDFSIVVTQGGFTDEFSSASGK